MGRTTFAPALGTDEWPWTDVDVFVLGSHRRARTPEHVIVDGDPARLLETIRAANRGGDVHLIGGPRTIETFRQLGALDELALIVLPLLLGNGMQLTPSVSPTPDSGSSVSAPSSGAVEILYARSLSHQFLSKQTPF
jgi:dihydrofolate reductase